VALRAVVVGGGIGGIAAAVALARAGIDVRVYEQAQQLAEVGAGVSLAPNGLRMLERLGVGEGIRRVGARYVSAQLRFSDGRAVRHEPHQFTQPGRNVGIHRADLLALLAGQLPPGTVPFTAADSFGSAVDNGAGLGQAIAQQLTQNRLDLLDARESLSSLATETGGKLFLDNNDINSGLANLLDENSSYYLLGFQPEQAKWDGKLHKIKVVVRNRPELTVLARRSYLARSDPPKPTSADPKIAEAIDAISSPRLCFRIGLKLEIVLPVGPNQVGGRNGSGHEPSSSSRANKDREMAGSNPMPY